MAEPTPYRVDFVADVICPYCWIGWARLKRALAQRPKLKPEIVWRPFQLDPTTPPEGRDRKAHMAAKFPDTARLEQMHRQIADMGRDEGIEFRFDAIERAPNTSAAHRLVLWSMSEGRQDAVIDALFTAYFHDGKDIGDHAVLADIATACGMDGEVIARSLAHGQDETLIDQTQRAAAQAGITGVPFYIFDQKLGLSGAQPLTTVLDAMDQAARAPARA
jgi:predicted DsbA family dithiol-disulfide isomerase